MLKKMIGCCLLMVILALGSSGFAASKSVPGKISEEKTIYLTFDDGPSVENTEAVLDVLDHEGIKATFFITGPGEDNPISQSDWNRIVARIAREGHIIGNHTYDHQYEKVYQSARAFMKSVDKLDAAVYKATGRHTELFRFPGGSNNSYLEARTHHRYSERVLATLLRDRGYRYFDWNVSSADAAVATNETKVIVSYVKKGVSENRRCIVLHHDSKFKSTTVEALKEEIAWVKKQGGRFDTLDHAEGSYLFRSQWRTR